MPTHDWTQSRFDTQGDYRGMVTCVQQWRCRNCNETINLPLGINPKDYDVTRCKSDNVFRSEPKPKEKWKHPIKGKGA